MFKKINMGEKVMGSLLLLAVIVAIAGLFGIYGMSRISKSLDEVVSVKLAAVTALEIIHEAQTAIQRDERTLLLRGTLNNEEKARLSGSMEGTWKRVESAWNIYEPLAKSQESENAWNKFKPAWAAWKNDQQKVFNLVKADRRNDAAAVSLGVALKSFNMAKEQLGEVISVTKKDTKAQTAGAITASSILKWVMICAIVLSILLYVSIVMSINRDMTHFLSGMRDEVRKIVNAVSRGNLTARGDPARVNYELRDIVKSFNEILDAITEPVKIASGDKERIASGEISPGAFGNSRRDVKDIFLEIVAQHNPSSGNFIPRADDATHHENAHMQVVSGIDEIIDTVADPVGAAFWSKRRHAGGEIFWNPGDSGQRLRQGPFHGRRPSIIASGILRKTETEEQVKSLEIRAYLTKPLTKNELSRVVVPGGSGDAG